VRPLDTSPAAHDFHIALYRRMTAAARIAIADRMSEDVRAIAAAGIRARHPEYDDATVLAAQRRVLVGDVLFRAAWPGAPLVPA
jgi:hypothetical protein